MNEDIIESNSQNKKDTENATSTNIHMNRDNTHLDTLPMNEETINNSLFNLQCYKEDFLTAVQIADGVVTNNSANPMQNNLKISVSPERIEILATDTQIALRAIVRRVTTTQTSNIIIPSRQLLSILKESHSEMVSLSLSDEKDHQLLMIKLSDGDYNLPIISGDTFPEISAFPQNSSAISINSDNLEQMIKKTSFAIDKDKSSAVLSGMFMSCNEREFILAATDGKVLAESIITDESFLEYENFSAIIPAITITHISRIISAQQARVDLSVQEKIIFMRTVLSGNEKGKGSIEVEISSRLIEGSYPAYRNAINTSSEITVTFQTKQLLSAVRRTALMTSSASSGMVITLTKNEAILSNLNHTTGVARIPISCIYSGSDLKIGMSAKYVYEVLKCIEEDKCIIELNGVGKGMIIRNEHTCFLIMPISLPN